MTTQPDPVTGSSLHLFGEMTNDLKRAIDGLPREALNWKPAGEDSNSISVLAYHSLMSTRQWLSVAFDAPPPDRDRDAEFSATFADFAALLAFIDDLATQCRGMLKAGQGTDWGAIRHHWDPAQDRPIPAAWALIHALEHLREHIGHVGLTRQLWESQSR